MVNSIAALGGIAFGEHGLGLQASFVAPLVVAVFVGGMAGASFGSRRLGGVGLRRVLGVVLLVAAIKMFLTILNNPPPTGTQLLVDVKLVL